MSQASRRARRVLLRVAWVALLAGCEGYASALDPGGPQAARIKELTLFLFGVGAIVYLAVIGVLLYALRRAHVRNSVESGPAAERRMVRAVVGGVVVTFTIVMVTLFLNLETGRSLASFADPGALTITVTGQQWWWEVVYEDPNPSRRLTTANEIYVPVGTPIRLVTGSRDVIHSFWAPNLHGKIDLIPGYSGTTYFQADEEGVYRGRCAEFCGLQHARMDFRVIAVSPDRFAVWYEGQLRPARVPTTVEEVAGREIFLSRGCVLCHTIRGTPAGSRVGPDLTHLASRSRLAAGTLPNTRGHLAGWVLDAQGIKPGARMPPNQLAPDELRALLAYLESLR